MDDMYALIERETGWIVGRFLTEAEALQAAASSIDDDDDWALVEFGPEPTDNALIVAGDDLRARAQLGIRPLRASSSSGRVAKYHLGITATVGLAAAVVVSTFGASTTTQLRFGRPSSHDQTLANVTHVLEVDA